MFTTNINYEVNALKLAADILELLLCFDLTQMTAKVGHANGRITFHYVPFNKRIVMFALNYSGRWNASKLDSSLWQTNENFFVKIHLALVCVFFMQIAHKEGEKGN